jgi:hypothetical protein
MTSKTEHTHHIYRLWTGSGLRTAFTMIITHTLRTGTLMLEVTLNKGKKSISISKKKF